MNSLQVDDLGCLISDAIEGINGSRYSSSDERYNRWEGSCWYLKDTGRRLAGIASDEVWRASDRRSSRWELQSFDDLPAELFAADYFLKS